MNTYQWHGTVKMTLNDKHIALDYFKRYMVSFSLKRFNYHHTGHIHNLINLSRLLKVKH